MNAETITMGRMDELMEVLRDAVAKVDDIRYFSELGDLSPKGAWQNLEDLINELIENLNDLKS